MRSNWRELCKHFVKNWRHNQYQCLCYYNHFRLRQNSYFLNYNNFKIHLKHSGNAIWISMRRFQVHTNSHKNSRHVVYSKVTNGRRKLSRKDHKQSWIFREKTAVRTKNGGHRRPRTTWDLMVSSTKNNRLVEVAGEPIHGLELVWSTSSVQGRWPMRDAEYGWFWCNSGFQRFENFDENVGIFIRSHLGNVSRCNGTERSEVI